MKFLLISSYAETLLNYRGSLIEALQRSGLSVHVAVPNLLREDPIRLMLEEKGLIVHGVPMLRTGTNPFRDFQTIFALWRLMRRIQPKFTMGYTIKPVVYGALAAWMAGVPRRFALISGLGYAFQGGGRRRGVELVAHILYTAALSRVHKVFFQNPDDEALFRGRKILASKTPSFVVNGSGVDVDHFSLAEFPSGGVVFLLTARLLGDKGVREFAEAAERVRNQYPLVRFALVGWIDSNPDSISESELNAWIEKGALEYWGQLSDVRPAIAASTVFVLPSYREGTPRTVLEAMAMGRPIITTDAPGCKETVINGENGFLIPVKSVDALEEAMLKFVRDDELAGKMGPRARFIAEEKYDVRKVNAIMLREMGI